MQDQKEYQREYYIKNKDRIAQRRKERYQNDPEYRRKILEATRKRRESISRVSTREVGRIFEDINGSMLRLFTSGRASEFAGLSKSKFTRWIREEKIPETPYVYKGIRYFTREQSEAVRSSVASGLSGDELFDDVQSRWKSLGIGPESIVKPS